MPLSRITVTVPGDVVRAADERARALDRSRSWVVAEALRRFVSGSSQAGLPAGRVAAVRESAVTNGPRDDVPYGGRFERGLGPYRQAQLEADLRLTVAERVLESERASLVTELAAPRSRYAQITAFDRFEDFLEWKRREGLQR